LGAIELGVPRARLIHRVKYGMPNVSTDGDGSGGSVALIGSSSVLAWRKYAICGLSIQHTPPSSFCRKPYLKAIVTLSAKAGRAFSCAQASNHRERGL